MKPASLTALDVARADPMGLFPSIVCHPVPIGLRSALYVLEYHTSSWSIGNHRLDCSNSIAAT